LKKRSFYIIFFFIIAASFIVLKVIDELPVNLQQYFPSEHRKEEIDTLEFAPQHSSFFASALDQLTEFPAPHFKEQHQLLPNFLWMDPRYLGNFAQPNCKVKECVILSTKIQAELANHWNYYFLVNSNLKAFNSYRDTSTFTGAWVKYANEHKKIAIAAISFWIQVQPNKVESTCNSKIAYAVNRELPDCCYVQNNNGEKISGNFPSPNTPVNALKCDFMAQSIYVDSLLAVLQRPLQMINDNGEVFKVYEDDFLAQDKRIVKEKNKFSNLNWNEFQAMKRLEKEIAFRNSFMLKPALANCLYTQYAIDGQNKYRHDYKTVRKINTPINHQYYSTPDFYPRYPYNWKKWQGPWHGLKWLNISRKTEIDLGDNLFSPFVAAGWDSIEVNNIRPAQWLGLLKILGAMGAEYYYSGFFNTSKAIAKPENYIWQAVMPVYAQAVTSFYEDVLRNGAMIYDDGLIQYPAKDVPVVIRKSNNLKTWVIACTWQTGSNYNKNVEEHKEVKIDLGHKKIKVKARRQGSVYVYSEENNSTIFYQIDGWHQYMHPYYWSRNMLLEAELYSKKITTSTNAKDDYTKFTSFASIDATIEIPFSFHGKTTKIKSIKLWIKNEFAPNNLTLKLNQHQIAQLKIVRQEKIQPYIIPMQSIHQNLINGKYVLTLSVSKPDLKLDKIEIETNE
jgi:hypothetical protein